MKIVYNTYLMLSLLFVIQCSTNNIFIDEYVGADGIILGETEKIKSFKFDQFNLNEMKVVGDSIIINLSYSGGCRDHVFKLIVTEYFGESTDPDTKLILSHNAKFDPCEQYITENHIFNLLPLKHEYMKVFEKETGSIRLVLDKQEVIYKF